VSATQLEHKIVWTACPYGVTAGGRLRLSVCVGHQLGTQGTISANNPVALTLRQFPIALDWDMQDVRFSVVFADETGKPVATVARGSVTVLNTARNAAIWPNMFDGNTPVQPYSFGDQSNSLSNRPIKTFAADVLNAQISERLGNVIGSALATRPPAATVLHENALGPLVVTPAERKMVQAHIRHYRQKGTTRTQFLQLATGNAQACFQEAYQFHTRSVGAATSATAYQSLPQPPYDFHNAIAALAQMPAIARLLGLIFDLEIALPKHLGLPAMGMVSVAPALVGGQAAPSTYNLRLLHVCPATAYQYEAPLSSSAGNPAGFLARPDPNRPVPQGGDIEQGMLALGNTDLFARVDMDIDGWVLKSVPYVRALQEKAPLNNQESAPPPSTRSAGISICRVQRDQAVTQMLASATAANALMTQLASATASSRGTGAGMNGAATCLYADDLLRGYRPDVYVESLDTWLSLCKRIGLYQIPGTSLDLQIADEGWVAHGSVSQDPTAPSAQPLATGPAIFRWSGYSLAASRPGTPPLTGPAPVPPPSSAFSLKLKGTFCAPSTAMPAVFTPVASEDQPSLPRLRFGERYALRARAVDLAGNSLPFTTTGATGGALATKPAPYSRLEPVPSPVVASGTSTPAIPGDSPARIVILSYYDPTTGTWHTPTPAMRLIMPPIGGVSLAELHGRFDRMSPQDAYALILAKQGTLPGKPYRVPDPDPGNPKHVVPYLADPLARGVAFRGLPGYGIDTLLAVPYEGAWPEVQAIRFTVAPATPQHPGSHPASAGSNGNAALPTVQRAPAPLTVYLEKAEQQTILVSSAIEPAIASLGQTGAEEIMAHWQSLASSWLPQTGSRRDLLAAQQQWHGNTEQQLRRLAQNGAFWWITPPHEITLVHAVQVPLLTPAFPPGGLLVNRALGQTFAELRGSPIDVDGKSTSKIEVLAQWSEWVDEPQSNAPPYQRGGGDQKHPAALARILERKLDPTDTKFELQVSRGAVAGPVLPLQEFGDTKYRLIAYSCKVTTRFAEYFPPPVGDGPPLTFSLDGPPTLVEIPSSAPPSAPLVRYVVPAFGWSSQSNRDFSGLTWNVSTRKGNLLRIYLERPWYSSGDDEQLAIVCGQTGSAAAGDVGLDNDPRDALVTHRGTDSVYWRWPDHNLFGAQYSESSCDPGELPKGQKCPPPSLTYGPVDTPAAPCLLPQEPGASWFNNAVAWTEDLGLVELSGLPASYNKVSAASFLVDYDARRDLWYADVDMDLADAQFPFLRLALARFQPHAMTADPSDPSTDCRLSRVVLADFVQVAPDRVATVLHYDPHKGPHTTPIQISGPRYTTIGMREPNITAMLEYKQPGNPGGDLWTPAVLDQHGGAVSVRLAVTPALNSDMSQTGSLWPSGNTIEMPAAGAAADGGWDTFSAAGTLQPQADQTLLGDAHASYRVVIREYESFGTDPMQSSIVAQPGPLDLDSPAGARLVYAAAIEVWTPGT